MERKARGGHQGSFCCIGGRHADLIPVLRECFILVLLRLVLLPLHLVRGSPSNIWWVGLNFTAPRSPCRTGQSTTGSGRTP